MEVKAHIYNYGYSLHSKKTVLDELSKTIDISLSDDKDDTTELDIINAELHGNFERAQRLLISKLANWNSLDKMKKELGDLYFRASRVILEFDNGVKFLIKDIFLSEKRTSNLILTTDDEKKLFNMKGAK